MTTLKPRSMEAISNGLTGEVQGASGRLKRTAKALIFQDLRRDTEPFAAGEPEGVVPAPRLMEKKT